MIYNMNFFLLSLVLGILALATDSFLPFGIACLVWMGLSFIENPKWHR